MAAFPVRTFATVDVARIVLDALFDRFESVLPPCVLPEEYPDLPADPAAVPYVHGLIEATLAALQTLDGHLMADIEAHLRLTDALALYAGRRLGADEDTGHGGIVHDLLERYMALGAVS